MARRMCSQITLTSRMVTSLVHVTDHIIEGLSHVLDVLFAHYMDVWSVDCFHDAGECHLQPLIDARPDLSR